MFAGSRPLVGAGTGRRRDAEAPPDDRERLLLELHAPLEDGALEDAAQPFFTTRAGRLGLGASLAARYAACMGGRFILRRDGNHTVAELHLPTERAA